MLDRDALELESCQCYRRSQGRKGKEAWWSLFTPPAVTQIQLATIPVLLEHDSTEDRVQA